MSLGSDLFAMELKYESVDASIAGAAQYNGNISQQIWATGTTVRHAYGYSYDGLNQLSSAVYEKYSGSWNQDAGRFTESATYDLNGNILTMIRGGKTGESTYGSMDNITMSYAGNKLIGANDAVTAVTGNYQFQEAMVSSVVEGNTSTHEYLYDVNGNMTQDKNKGITVVYNYLNLPIQVNFGPNDRIDWTYTATGAKLQKKVYTNGSLTLTQDYVSGFVYKNGSLDFFSTETWRVKNQSGTLKYQYTITDHLGNTRVMFADTGSGTAVAIEESHYYAFAMRIEGLSTSSPDNKFTYNGKELEDDHGLNWYHYGARFYDAQIGRWHVVDPSDQFNSPYLSLANNPIRYIDPDGKDVYEFDTQGKLLSQRKADGPDRFFVNIGEDHSHGMGLEEITMESDLGYLSRIVYAEAGGASKIGKEIVAEVVLNRVESQYYPNTVQGVIEEVYVSKSGAVTHAFSALYWNEKHYNDPLSETNPLERRAFANSVAASVKAYYGGGDVTSGATMYYSPATLRAQGYPDPGWDTNLNYEETTPAGVDSEEFRTFREVREDNP